MVSQVPEDFGGLRRLSGALVNHARLILRHGCKLFVLARTNLLHLFESLIVALKVLIAKSCVIGGETSGVRVRILLGDCGKLLSGILGARGFRGIERFTRIV